ncbi:MAG: hypothetical protein R2779_04210 [Crocinitomicaceae bacterium]
MYLADSGGVAPAASIYVNGVIVGKVLDVKLTGKKEENKKF